MQNKVIKERYEFVDLLKAVAVFIVIIYHYNNLKINFLETQDMMTYFNYFSITIYCIGIPIFFFVNGALLLNKDLNLKRHISKLLHIVILTIVWGIITLLILMPIRNEYMTLFEFAKCLWTLKLDWINHLWFFQALVVVYIFFPLIKVTYDNEMKALYFFMAIIFLMTLGNVFLSNCANVLEFLIGKNYLHGNFNFFHDFNAFRGIHAYLIFYFILGGVFIKHKEKFRDKKWVKIAASTIVISMVLLTLYGVLMSKSNGELYDIPWNGIDTIPTLLMVVAIFILSLRYNNKHKISILVNIIGKNSLGIYLVHRIWGTLLIRYFKEISYSQNLIINILFAIAITLISLLSVLLLKRIPIVKKLFII